MGPRCQSIAYRRGSRARLGRTQLLGAEYGKPDFGIESEAGSLNNNTFSRFHEKRRSIIIMSMTTVKQFVGVLSSIYIYTVLIRLTASLRRQILATTDTKQHDTIEAHLSRPSPGSCTLLFLSTTDRPPSCRAAATANGAS